MTTIGAPMLIIHCLYQGVVTSSLIIKRVTAWIFIFYLTKGSLNTSSWHIRPSKVFPWRTGTWLSNVGFEIIDFAPESLEQELLKYVILDLLLILFRTMPVRGFVLTGFSAWISWGNSLDILNKKNYATFSNSVYTVPFWRKAAIPPGEYYLYRRIPVMLFENWHPILDVAIVLRFRSNYIFVLLPFKHVTGLARISFQSALFVLAHHKVALVGV